MSGADRAHRRVDVSGRPQRRPDTPLGRRAPAVRAALAVFQINIYAGPLEPAGPPDNRPVLGR